MDPVLLAGWIAERGVPPTVLDVGSGSGVMSLLLAKQGARVVGVDAFAEWQPWAERAAEASGLSDRVSFVTADVRTAALPRVALAVCNPPYFPVGKGHLPQDPMRAFARHTLNGGLAELLAPVSYVTDRIAVVVPTEVAPEARRVLAELGCPVVHSLVLAPRLVLYEGNRSGAALSEEHSFLRHDDRHHPRVARLFASVGAPLRDGLA